MKILVGPDSLKDSVSASEFCQIAKEVVETHWPEDQILTIPLADGGEGTVDALVEGTNGTFIHINVTGPLGEPVTARYGLIYEGAVAVIEMAAASGLPLVPIEKRNPMKTTTYGTGQLIFDAIKKGCKKIIIGIGGSATNDAGLGMMQALGFKCLDENGDPVPFGGDGLLKLKTIERPEYDIFDTLDIQVACDVNNPLYGLNGASHIYSRQKGADDAMVETLDLGLINFANVIKNSLNLSIETLPGGGAAGGLGAGLNAALGGKLLPGFEIIRETVNLDDILKNDFDLVITAEGQMNRQSLMGKLPVELAKLAKANGIPTIALVGARDLDLDKIKDTGLIGIFPIASGPMSLENSMANGKALIRDTLLNLLTMLHAL